MKKFTICLTLFACGCGLTSASEFDYEHQAKWYDEYQDCRKNRQSPIELSSTDAELSYDIPALSFAHYDTPYSLPAKGENNGHTANIVLPKASNYNKNLWQACDRLSPHISGGPLPEARFIAESLHFHWGSEDLHGSEHVIDSERYSMEMHILHRNTKYQTVEEAREHDDGLAVLAILYAVNSTMKSDFAGLERVISALEFIAEFNKTSEIQNFTLSKLIGNLDLADFFTYAGSLTTPPCSQAVTWVVFAHSIAVSHAQMDRFHKLNDGNGGILENNYRSLQAKGSRKVYLRQKRKVIDSTIENNEFWELFWKGKINETATQQATRRK